MRTDIDLVESLEDLARQAPAGHAVLRDLARARHRRNARRRMVWAAVGVTTVLVAVLALTLPMTLRAPRVVPAAPVQTDQRVPGNWSMLHTVTPPSGWKVAQREVYLLAEQSVLVPVGENPQDLGCSVVLETSETAADDPEGAPATIAGKRGTYIAPSEQTAAEFRWHPAGRSDLSLSATCGKMKDPRAMIAQVVPGVALRQQELRIPFRLTDLPAGVVVKAAYQGEKQFPWTRGVDLGANDDPNDPGKVNVYATQQNPFFEGVTLTRIQVGDREVEVDASLPAACFTGSIRLCVSDTSGELGPQPAGQLSARMLGVLEAIEPAADLDDPSTWPLANDALPR